MLESSCLALPAFAYEIVQFCNSVFNSREQSSNHKIYTYSFTYTHTLSLALFRWKIFRCFFDSQTVKLYSLQNGNEFHLLHKPVALKWTVRIFWWISTTQRKRCNKLRFIHENALFILVCGASNYRLESCKDFSEIIFTLSFELEDFFSLASRLTYNWFQADKLVLDFLNKNAPKTKGKVE